MASQVQGVYLPRNTAIASPTFSCCSIFSRIGVRGHLKSAAHQADSYIHKLYYDELASRVAWLPLCTSPSGFLASIDQITDECEALVTEATTQVDQLIAKLGEQTVDALIPEADQLYRRCLLSLANLLNGSITKVQAAFYTGQLTTIFRCLDDALSEQETLHRYCGCHIKTKGEDDGLKMLAPWFQKQDSHSFVDRLQEEVIESFPKRSSVIVLSQSYGGGHNAAQHAVCQRLAEVGAHAYKMDASDEVMEAYYNYRKWTGLSGAEWSEWCLRNNHYRTIRFLGWLSSGRDSFSTREKKAVCFTVALLARGVQRTAVTCFQRGTAPLDRATNRLGMGLCEIATDLDKVVYDMQRDGQNSFFRHCTMVRGSSDEGRLEESLWQEQCVETGFPVRAAFLKHYTETELQAIRARYKKEWGLAPDARVVILLNGSVGVSNSLATLIIDNYPSKAPNMHLFTICGKNGEMRKELTRQFQSLNRSNMQATAFGWTDETTLGELLAMGALEVEKGLLISVKAGGATVSEGAARGIPMLLTERGNIAHEQENLKFVSRYQLGAIFKTDEEVPGKIVEMFSKPYQPLPAPSGESFSSFYSKEKSMRVIGGIARASGHDPSFELRRQVMMGKLPKALTLPTSKPIAFFQKYGWDAFITPQLLSDAKYIAFLNFLHASRLLFSLRGYEVSLMQKQITMIDDKPHILKNGMWTSWDQIHAEFSYAASEGITLKGDSAKASWYYSFPQGLIQGQVGHITPVYQLSETQRDWLYAHSQNYFATVEASETLPQGKRAYVQVVTDAEGFSDRIGSHITIRIIDHTGALYSLDFRRPREEAHLKWASLFGNYNGVISLGGYKECGKFQNCSVTTVPISEKEAQRLLSKVQTYADQPLNYNLLNQNCASFTADILQEIGVAVDVQASSVAAVLFQAAAPHWLQKIVDAGQRVFACIPKCIAAPIRFIVTCLTFVPARLISLIKNLILLVLGMDRSGARLKTTEGSIEQNGQFTTPSRFIKKWTDLFSDVPLHPVYPILEWQKKQNTTRIYGYEGPKFYGI